jgi:hypothetical protein
MVIIAARNGVRDGRREREAGTANSDLGTAAIKFGSQGTRKETARR